MPYIGKQLVRGQNRELDDISGSFNGFNTTFNLTVNGDSITPGSALQLFISVGGVLQNPNTDFTVAGNQITFTTAPATSLSFFGILQGDAIDFNTPADGSVTNAKLGSNLTINVADGTAGTPSIQFNGSGTDTGFYSPGADQVAISTSGTGRLFIDSSGNIGIGTSSPGSLLNLAASNDGISAVSSANNRLRFTDTDTAVGSNFQITGAIEFETSDASSAGVQAYIAGESSTTGFGNLLFGTGQGGSASTRMFIQSDGKVGVGTTSPAALFDANGLGRFLSASPSYPASGKGLEIYFDSAGDLGYLQAYDRTGSTWKGLTLAGDTVRFRTAGNEVGRFDGSGRLLVGTSSNVADASSLLQVSSAGGPKIALNLQDGTVTSGQSVAGIDFYSFGGFVNESIASIQAYADGAHASGDKPGRLVFSTTANGASSPTERMRIRNGGPIDCWGGNADNTLHVLSTQGAGTTYALFWGGHSSTGPGNFGTNSVKIYTNGNIQNTNNSYGALSDVKLKENIVDATSQWSDIKALQVRKYNLKEDQTHTQIGLVAQEVELVSPGLVSESPDRDEDGNDLGTTTKSVNYSVLYMKAVKALQEAMERIETLETSNADLLARVSALESA